MKDCGGFFFFFKNKVGMVVAKWQLVYVFQGAKFWELS